MVTIRTAALGPVPTRAGGPPWKCRVNGRASASAHQGGRAALKAPSKRRGPCLVEVSPIGARTFAAEPVSQVWVGVEYGSGVRLKRHQGGRY